MSATSLDQPTPAPPQRAAPGQQPSRARFRRGISGWTVLLLVGCAALLMLFPFWLALANAFKTPQDYISGSPVDLPEAIDLTAVIDFWQGVDFGEKLLNSVLLSGGVALAAVVISLLNAFAIGIGRVRGRIWILAIFMIAFTIPQEALVYPLFILSRDLGMYDSLLGVGIILAVLQSAFGTYMLSAVLGTFPREVLEAAQLDGITRFQLLRLIILPLSRPTVMILMTFFFIWTWNEFFLPLVLLPSSRNQTVSVALGALSGQYTSDPTALAAASLVGILPAIIFFALFQRTLMRGINIGAVK